MVNNSRLSFCITSVTCTTQFRRNGIRATGNFKMLTIFRAVNASVAPSECRGEVTIYMEMIKTLV